jgi:ribonuclease BN (tRNA processing enzyme)
VGELTLLGSGGWIPTSRRETCCAMARDGDRVLLIDAGTGLHRLVENPGLLAGVEGIDIVLTHFHLDHVAGLSYLPALPSPPTVWGPGELLYGTPTAEILDRLLGRPLFAAPLDALTEEVHEIPGEPFEAAGMKISTRMQRLHSDPTLALRIGDAFTYCTDTAADEGNAEFAAGSGLLFHEAWHATASTDDEIHTAAGEAGRIASAAGVERLVLIHVNPLQSSDEELLGAARAEFAAAEVGEDLVPLQSGQEGSSAADR